MNWKLIFQGHECWLPAKQAPPKSIIIGALGLILEKGQIMLVKRMGKTVVDCIFENKKRSKFLK